MRAGGCGGPWLVDVQLRVSTPAMGYTVQILDDYDNGIASVKVMAIT